MEAHDAVDNAGSLCEIKSLYNHSSDTSTANDKWSEFESPTAEEQRVLGLGKHFAIIHRHSRIGQDDGEIGWITHSIEARSPRLRKFLDQIFADYPSWYPDGSPYSGSPPFKPYVHRWGDISTALEEGDLTAKQDLQLLHRVLEPRLKQHLYILGKAKEAGALAFKLLWLILAPGCLMISREGGKICVSKLRRTQLEPASFSGPPHWKLKLCQIYWNGSFTGVRTMVKEISEYEGLMSITKLGTYPLQFEPNHEMIREEMLARGRKFEQLRGFHVATYSGKKYTSRENPYREHWKEIQKQVSGRIIIDAHAYINCQEDLPPQPGLMRTEVWEKALGHEGTPEDPEAETTSDDGSEDEGGHIKERREELHPLSDLECVLAVPRVKGFDLSAKEWCEFDLDDIGEANWDETPYTNLVLPTGDKDLVMAFADRRRNSHTFFDDFVQHKGEGIIILLSGPPGVGKTLTAEAVAEKSKTPLFVLSASDLGSDPSKVDKALSNALECCRIWRAILLLDEADVFLVRRDSNSFARNELVSIFLRRLEYYRGLMFLATNRISNIDPAFKSRIDLILPYHDLDEPSRRALWVKFIERHVPGPANISGEGYDELAKAELNGREIKNTVKTAFVLSQHKGEPISLSHLRTVLGIRKRVATAEFGNGRPVKRLRTDDHA